ncbi:hypothetical protein HZC31_06400 [Candidatus Woesearchaeota archaeon]|nr:hypothetical protein [Candidatus Woesearchaeota archaeon]
MAQASTTEQDFFGNEPSLDSSLQAVEAEIEPETYSEFYDLVTERLFKTSAEEGIGFLGKYIERRGSFWGLGSVGTSLRKHSYLQEDIAKSHPNDPDRIEEALVQLRDTKRENGRLTLDDVVATSYLLTDEFDRRATFLLAYELDYLEARELGVSVSSKGKTGTTQRAPTKTEGEAYVADILQWMDYATSKRMPFRELIRGIHFFLINSLELYATAVHDIKQKNYTVAQIKLTGLRAAADKGLANIEGPIIYQLAQIALKTKNDALAEERLRECVMMPSTAFPTQFGIHIEDAYQALLELYQKRKNIDAAHEILSHAKRYNAVTQEHYVSVARLCYKLYRGQDVIALINEGINRFSEHDRLRAYKQDVVNDWFELGGKAEKDKDYSDARAYYRRIIEFEPTHTQAYLRIAQTYEAQGRKLEARMHYQKTLALDKRVTEAQQGLKRVQ